MAGTYNLELDQGADFGVTFTYKAPGGSAVDVTGWTALMQLRTAPGSTVLLELTDAAGITVGTTDGTFAVAITAAQSAAIDQDCHYDLVITDPGGTKVRLIEGTVRVDRAISSSP